MSICAGSLHTPALPPSHSFCFSISLGSSGGFALPAPPQSLPFILRLYVPLCFYPFVCMHACDFFTCVYVCTRDPSPTEMSVEPWASPQDQAAAELSHSEHTDTPPSQDQEQRPDKLCLDSFWSEVENIQQGSGYADDCSRRDSKHSEGKYCRSCTD